MTNRLTLLLLFFALPFSWAFGQHAPTEKYLEDELSLFAHDTELYRLTIFVIPSKVKYDWSSPQSLYKSLFKNYKRNFFKKERYLLGHAFMELTTTSADELIFTGMRANSRDEQKQMLFEDYYGLSVLGADMTGRLEKSPDLVTKMEKYSQKGRLAFITLLINRDAAQRMLEFFQVYESNDDTLLSPKFHYGGAYYPRYHGEGAGCSAFTIAFLDLGGLLREYYEQWKIEIDIPMDLMGGPYHEGNDVRLKDVRKRTHWADKSSGEGMYEPFEIYDPTLMYDWIHGLWDEPRNISGMQVVPANINKARGIIIDARQEKAPVEEDIFIDREKPSVFVK